MSVYIINLAFIAAFGLISRIKFRINEKRISGTWVCECFLCLIFSVIMALRALSVGVDTAPYSRIFSAIAKESTLFHALKGSELSAPLYVILCRLLSHVSDNPQILTVVTAMIVNTGLFVFIHNNSEYPAYSAFCWVGLTLFYCSMNGNRQCIAVVFTLNAMSCLSRNLKDKKGWILFLSAVMIHSTALIMLAGIGGIRLAERFRNTSRIFVVSVLLSAVFGMLFGVVVNIFIRVFPRYSMYTENGSRYSVFQGSGGGRIILLYLFLFCLSILWVLQAGRQNLKYGAFHKKILPAVVFCTVFGAMNCRNELINRMLWFYLALYISFIPDLLYKCKKVHRLLLGTGIVFVLLVYSFLSLRENQNGVVPYALFWNI